MTVVRFPEFWTTAQTLVPSVETASARGTLPNSATGVGAALRLDRLYTSIVSSLETDTNARPPANTTSVGSSPGRRVFVTMPRVRSTMLIESDRLLKTQTSVAVRGRTVTGS